MELAKKKTESVLQRSERSPVIKETTSPEKALEKIFSYRKVEQTWTMKEGLGQEEQLKIDYITEKLEKGNT